MASTVGHYATQFTNFVSTNFESFKNATSKYGNQFLENETVKKVVDWARPHFNKAAECYPEWAKFSWSTGTAVATLFTTVLALFTISFFAGGVGRTAR